MASWVCSSSCAAGNLRTQCFQTQRSQVRSAPRLARRCIQRIRAQTSSGDGQPSPAQVQQAMEEAMKDPAARERMEKMQAMMQNPAVQQQMQQMQAMMANPQVLQRMQQLREDPELKPMFEEIQKGGMGAMMKAMNNPEFLKKVGERMGDVVPGAVNAGPVAAPPEPEINNLLDAARFGDVEALEDFLAVGKDINMKDAEGRTPLHYGVAYSQVDVVSMLISEGADLESTDSMNNTALHYAAGYGRVDAIEKLLDAGASVTARNQTGKTPFELARAAPDNPVNKETELLKRLEAGAGVSS